MGFGSFLAKQIFRRMLPTMSLGMNAASLAEKGDEESPSGSSQGSEELDDRRRTVTIFIKLYLRQFKSNLP